MLTPDQISEPGPYRYRDLMGGEALPVEVLQDGEDLVVRFPPLDGDEGADLLLSDLSGEFERA